MTDDDPGSRIASLIRSMTLAEKIGQLTMISGGVETAGAELSDRQIDLIRAGEAGSVLNVMGIDAISAARRAASQTRLGIGTLVCLDVLHGHDTIFPIPLGEAAAFDPALWTETARVAAEETRAADIDLTFAPMLDVARDPRWGRIAESFGEDPCVGARFAEAKVKGFQQDFADGAPFLAATAKHLGAYGAVIAGREYNSVDISSRALHEVHLPAFEAAVRSGVAAIMPSFNDLAGVPMTANVAILRELVRERWGFDGVMISDYSAVAELITHGVAADLAEAAALPLKAGIDIDMVSDAYPQGLPIALERELIDEALIDEAVSRVLQLKARLGLLSGSSAKASRPQAGGALEQHRALAREAAQRSMVLLQNRGGLLPLFEGQGQSLAIIGPLADARQDMLGPWWANGKPDSVTTFLKGLRDGLSGWSLAHARGSGITKDDPASFTEAIDIARNADMIVLCLGEAASMSGEAASRAQPDIPASQRRLAEAVFDLGKPVIVTLSAGRPLVAPWLFDRADAVVVTWFPGIEAGPALADLLSGRVDPTAKLPVCWPADAGQIPIFYAQRPTGRPADPANGMTSRYIDAPVEPQFPFGHGLSYTRFSYRDLRLSAETLRPGETVIVETEIVNDGPVDGEEIAFLFIRDPVASVTRPTLELEGFARVSVAAGASETARFALSTDDIAFPDENGRRVLEAGKIEIAVGPNADPASLLRTQLEIETR